MGTVNFLAGGLTGDFINSLCACKNICERDGVKANLFITDGYLADPFRFGVQKTFKDTYDLIASQDYINSYQVLPSNFNEPYTNLNYWRKEVHETYRKTGGYNKCWTELLAETFDYKIGEYKWLSVPPLNTDLIDRVVIHRSLQRHNSAFREQFEWLDERPVFLTTNQNEYDNFEYKERSDLLLVNTVTEMAIAIRSCKLFIGNQSSPFALASALDVNRICELCPNDAAPFYIDETKYSKKLKLLR